MKHIVTLKKTILGVRNMAYELRPPVLEELGLVETMTDELGLVTTLGYDGLNRQISVTTGTSAQAVTMDSLGRTTAQTSPLGHTVDYEYDADHNMTVKYNRLGTPAYFAYDSEDRAYRNWQDGEVNELG